MVWRVGAIFCAWLCWKGVMILKYISNAMLVIVYFFASPRDKLKGLTMILVGSTRFIAFGYTFFNEVA